MGQEALSSRQMLPRSMIQKLQILLISKILSLEIVLLFCLLGPLRRTDLVMPW